MITGPLLFIAGGALLTSILAGWTAPRLWLTATLVGASAAFAAAVIVLGGGADWVWRSEFSMGGELLHLRLDGISAFFLVLLCVVGGAAQR